jgi:hypothetical protein
LFDHCPSCRKTPPVTRYWPNQSALLPAELIGAILDQLGTGLAEGGTVVDVGCGYAAPTLAVAAHFPAASAGHRRPASRTAPVAGFFATAPADGRLDLIRLVATRANGPSRRTCPTTRAAIATGTESWSSRSPTTAAQLLPAGPTRTCSDLRPAHHRDLTRGPSSAQKQKILVSPAGYWITKGSRERAIASASQVVAVTEFPMEVRRVMAIGVAHCQGYERPDQPGEAGRFTPRFDG